jgi:hypothetical protein
MDEAPLHWFLTPEQRGNPDTDLDRRRSEAVAWTSGNHVETLVHGRPYFERLAGRLRQLGPGDRMHFIDWRGDDDQILADDGTTLGELLVLLTRRGVEIRGLLWRSHTRALGFSREEHARLAERINAEGGLVLLDHRVRSFGSHHQKLVIISHRDGSTDDAAFVGGIDL